MLACYEWIHGVLDVWPALSCQFNVSDLSGSCAVNARPDVPIILVYSS